MRIRDEFLDLLDKDPQFRDEVRRKILTDELLMLPSTVKQLNQAMSELAETLKHFIASTGDAST